MAIINSPFNFNGSFGNMRCYFDPATGQWILAKNGGFNKNQYDTLPSLKVTRENTNEFAGCGIAVKAIRIGLLQLIPEYTDTLFTGRLVKLVKMINVRDETGERGKRAINFSLNKPILKTLVFNVRKKFDIQFRRLHHALSS